MHRHTDKRTGTLMDQLDLKIGVTGVYRRCNEMRFTILMYNLAIIFLITIIQCVHKANLVSNSRVITIYM